MKNKWLIWIVVLLLVTNVSAIITIINFNRENKNAVAGTTPGESDSETSMQYSGRWFRDELRLSRDQMNEFSRFNPVFRQNIRNINQELNKMKRLMLEEMNSGLSDTVRLNSLSDSIGRLHSELKKVTWSYYLEFKRICTPEQQEKLRQVFAGIFEGEIPTGGRGRGMQGGRRFGFTGKLHEIEE